MNRKLVTLLCATMALCVLAGMSGPSSQAAITRGNHANASASLGQKNLGTNITNGILSEKRVLEQLAVYTFPWYWNEIDGGKKPRIPERPRQVRPGTSVCFSTVPVLDDRMSFTGFSPARNANGNKDVTPQHRNVLPGLRVLERSTRPISFRAPIVDQPEGTVKFYKRTGGQFRAPNEGLTALSFGQQAGTIKAVENGNKIYFKNLLYDPNNYLLSNFVQYGASGADYWIEGTKSGNTIIIQLGQTIVDLSAQGLNIVLKRGTTRSTSSGVGFTVSSAATATFTVNGDVLTLNNSAQSTTGYGNGLAAVWDDDNTWANVINFGTKLTAIGDIPEAPVMYTDEDIDAMDGDFVTYYRTGYTWFPEQNTLGQTVLDMNEQKGAGRIFYDEDGKTVYFRDPVYGWSNGMWVKGTKDGNQLSFPLGQYLYWDEDFFGMRTVWGTMAVSEDNYMNFTEDPDVTEVTFTIDGDHLTMNGCGMPDENSYTGLALMTDSAYFEQGWYGCLDFWTFYYDIPATPTNVTVDPAATTANVAWDNQGNSKWNVRYRVWEDPSDRDYYVCDFEDTTTVSKWWGLDCDTDNRWWVHYQSREDGNKYLASASYINNVGPLTPDNWLISPEVKLDGIVKFTAWGADAGWYKEVFKVYLFVGDTATIVNPEDDFIAISGDVVTTAEKTVYTFDIPDEYKGQMGYVAIRHYNVCDEYWLCLDDFYVGNPDAVPQWIYFYGVEQPDALLEGLTPETNYELQVQGVNPGGVGGWTEAVQFMTLPYQPVVVRGDVDGNDRVEMDDLTLLINYLLNEEAYLDEINYDNAAICDALTGDASEVVTMDDMTALINKLLTDEW